MICVFHMLARSISTKHLVNTFHLQDHHRRNTKISTTGGHEYAQRAPTFPLGSDRKTSASCCCIASRAAFSLCIPCCPAGTVHGTQLGDWQRITAQTAIAGYPCPPPQGKAVLHSHLPPAPREEINLRSGGKHSSAAASPKFCWL